MLDGFEVRFDFDSVKVSCWIGSRLGSILKVLRWFKI